MLWQVVPAASACRACRPTAEGLICTVFVPCTAACAQNNPPAELVAVQAMYNHRAIQLSFLVACMYTAVGALNLGFLTNFLSHSVIGGFTSGAAISEWQLAEVCQLCLNAQAKAAMLCWCLSLESCRWPIRCSLPFTLTTAPLLLCAGCPCCCMQSSACLRWAAWLCSDVQNISWFDPLPLSSKQSPSVASPVLCICRCAIRCAVLCCGWCLLQLKYILGFNISRADKLYEQIHLYIEGMGSFVWQEYVMGMSLLT